MRPLTVLLVDPHDHSRATYKTYLSSAGHTVFETTDGNSAVELLNTKPIDVVITELYLHGLSGHSLILALREQSRHDNVPIVVLTSQYDHIQKREAEEAGTSAFLTHPTTPAELLTVVERVTAGR